MISSNFFCLSQSRGVLPEGALLLLSGTGCEMLSDTGQRQRRRSIKDQDLEVEGVLINKRATYVIGGIAGVLFEATLDTSFGTTVVRFLLRRGIDPDVLEELGPPNETRVEPDALDRVLRRAECMN